MDDKKDEHERQFNKEKDESIKKLFTSSFAYAVKRHAFDAEKYYIEDVTEVLADYQTLILRIIDELIDGSFVIMKEFGDKVHKVMISTTIARVVSLYRIRVRAGTNQDDDGAP